MKYFKTLVLASSLIAANSAVNAAEINTAGQAMGLCKEQAQNAHPGYKRSKSTKIKQTRGVFKITLKVMTETEKFKTFCEVNKDGTVSYAKA